MSSRMLVCIDCGQMGNEAAKQYTAPAEVEGDNEFATQMVVKMGFVYLGCPVCKSPNLFLQPGAPTLEAPTETTYDDDDVEIDVSDMVDEEDEEEEVVEEPKPVRKKKKKKKNKVRARRRIGADGEMKTEYVEDTSVDTDDGIDVEFKKGPPVPRKMYHRECKTPTCGKDFTTKHSHVGHCPKCLKRFTGG